MEKPKVKITLRNAQLMALRILYKELVYESDPQGPHEDLLHEHNIALYKRLELLAEKDQSQTTLSLTALEAMAFCQTWADVDFKTDPYKALIVTTITGQIDKTVKRIRYANIQQ